MKEISTTHALVLKVLWIAMLFLATPTAVLTAQTQVFANIIVNESNVDLATNATDGDLATKAEVRAFPGRLLPLPVQPSYSGVLEMEFPSLLPANTTSYVKIDTDYNLLPALLGGSLGGVLTEILDLVLIGNQEFTVEALNNNTVVLDGDSAVENSFAQSNLKIIIDAAGNYYIALTPTQPYNRIRLTNRINTIIELDPDPVKKLSVYGAYYVSDANNCGGASFTSFDGSGLNLDALTLGGAGVTNPENVLDNDETTFSELSLGLIAVGASIEQIIYFEGASAATDNFSIRLRLDPSLLTLGIANFINIKGYNGDTLVQSTELSALLNVDLLTLLQNNQIGTISFTPGAPIDRIAIEFSSFASVSITQRLELYDVTRTPALPTIDAGSQNVTICEGDTASLVATANPASLQLKWYDAIIGGNLLATVNSGEVFNTPVVTTDTTFYVATNKVGCANESVRLPVVVLVQENTLAPTITLDSNITVDDIVNATEAAGNVIIEGTASGDAKVNDEVKLFINSTEYTGTVGSDFRFSITVNGSDLVADSDKIIDASLETSNGVCSRIITDTEAYEIDLVNPVVPTVDLLTTNDTTPTLTGTVDSDDTLTVTVNGITYTEGDGNLTDNTNDTWTLQIPTGNELPENTYDVEAIATDTAGNESTDITSNELTIDTSDPFVPTVDLLTTNDTTPTLTGTVDSDDTLTVTVNGITYTEGDGNLTDNTNDTWTLQIPTGNELPENTYDVEAIATDTAGNESTDITSNELTIDTSDPFVPTVDLLTTNDTTPTLTGTVDSDDNLTVTVNGVTYTEGDGDLTDNTNDTWTLQIPTGNELPENTYDVEAIATDTAGNESTDITSNELTIDTSDPFVPTVDLLTTNDTTPTLTGTVDSDDNLTVRVNGVTYTEGDGNLTDNTNDTWTLQIPTGNELPENTYDVEAIATDTAGNESTDITSNELTIDTSDPFVPTVDLLTTNDTTPTLTGTVDSDDALTVRVNGVTYTEGDGDLTDNTNDTWTLQIPIGNELPENTYDVEAIATDTAGNESIDITSNELTIDTSGGPEAPIVVIVEDTNNDGFINRDELDGLIDATISLPALAAPGETITINGAAQTITASQVADGEIRITYTNPGEGNTLTVLATYTNAAAVTSVQGEDSATIATTMPVIPTVDAQETSDTTPLITGTADSDDALMVEVDGEMYYEGDGDLVDNTDDTWALQIPDDNALEDGIYDVVVEATNTAGNVATDQTTNELQLRSKAVSLVTDLAVIKVVDNMNPSIGETVVFTITVQNLGQTKVDSVEVSEVIQSGFTFSNAKATVGNYDLNTSIWMISTLEPNTSAELNITVKVNESGEYFNTAIVQSSLPEDQDMSNNSSEIELNINCITVFNEFTPNNDGSNDFLTIDCIENYPNSIFEVYNRYGNVVYQSQAYKNDWDGMSNVSGVVQKGKTLPTGTYFYVLKVDPTMKEKTGWIYIGR
ncbi:Ig-like domain-containing protein [Aquimarina sp. W85]|uniref:Ig-like domain-containing protein n=1 Tax=Aquimarina rhodophyticola TaxID=3342246 RepID=UPI00366C35F8